MSVVEVILKMKPFVYYWCWFDSARRVLPPTSRHCFCNASVSKHTLSAGETADGGLWCLQGFDVEVDIKTPLAAETWDKKGSFFSESFF